MPTDSIQRIGSKTKTRYQQRCQRCFSSIEKGQTAIFGSLDRIEKGFGWCCQECTSDLGAVKSGQEAFGEELPKQNKTVQTEGQEGSTSSRSTQTEERVPWWRFW